MKDICIIICNYNGREYIVNCIESLQKQTIDNFEICVVDNGSIDGSKELLEERFGDFVYILRNEENLGGAGGFETGIQYALIENYPYIALLDNDITLAENTIELLYKRLKIDEGIGIIGSRILYMDKPDKVMWYGFHIDFENLCLKQDYNDVSVNDPNLPEEIECDYIPACTAIATRKALLECGTMPVDNFIYHDDLELCYRMKKYGYRVVMLKEAISYHKGGGSRNGKITTFGRYYEIRNRFYFFAKYIPEDRIDAFIHYVFDSVFDTMFGCFYKNKMEIFKVYWYAFDDFIHGIKGKAGSGRILEIMPEKFEYISKVVNGHRLIYIQGDSKEEGYEWATQRIKGKIKYFVPDALIQEIALENIVDEPEAITFVYCKHVKEMKEKILPKIYFDQWLNLIANEEDFFYYQSYGSRKTMFEAVYQPMLEERIHIIRSK